MERQGTARYFFAAFSGAMFVIVSIAFADSKVAGQVFEALRASLTPIVALAGVWIASQGLRTWKRQLQGTARFDACRKFYEACLRWRDAMATARSPMISASEMASAMEAKQEKLDPFDTETTNKAERLVNAARWTRVVEAMQRCEADGIGLEVLLGSEVRGLVRQMRSQSIRFRQSLEARHREQTSNRPMKEDQQDVLWDTGEDNAFTQAVARTVSAAEALVAPHVRHHFE